MLADVAPLLACPVCGAGLRADPPQDAPPRLVCPAGHAYDVARQGHVSLLAGRHRHPGDTADMVAHRLAFLAAGHYAPIAAAVAELAESVPAPGVLLDIGAGPGWYAARLLDHLPARHGLALDSSTAAIRRAARAHPRLAAVVADATGRWPVRDASVAVATCLFAPRNGPEIARVLAPGGAVLVATPAPDHLDPVREALGMLAIAPDKDERLAASLAAAGLVERRRRDVRRVLRLSHADLGHLALMGPAAFHRSPQEVATAVAALPAVVDVELAVVVREYSSR